MLKRKARPNYDLEDNDNNDKTVSLGSQLLRISLRYSIMEV